jgi:hypothetical protein
MALVESGINRKAVIREGRGDFWQYLPVLHPGNMFLLNKQNCAQQYIKNGDF